MCPKISIIVPVYNVERYLRRCVDSIVAQSFQDWELLLIDDGSSDNSGMICDEYAEKEDRIKVFHKKNGGVSSARNVGLDNANGEWIMFVDSDDWIEKTMLEENLIHSECYEVIRCNMKVITNNSIIINYNYINEKWTYDEYLLRVVSRQTILGVYAGLFQRTLFNRDSRIRFDLRYTMGEDWLVLFYILKKTRKIKLLDKPLYNYNQTNMESAVHTMNLTKIYQLVDITFKISQDPYINIHMPKAVATCKGEICAKILAGLILKKKGLISNNTLIQYMKKRIFPTIPEIFQCILPIKYKILLLLFSIAK